MNEKELIQKCLINKDAIETYPFKDEKYKGTPILRHESNNKWFGVIFKLNNILYINLKAKPEIVAILKEEYPNIITSAWHMNKIHWFKVDVNNIESDVLDALIKQSFDITATKKQKI